MYLFPELRIRLFKTDPDPSRKTVPSRVDFFYGAGYIDQLQTKIYFDFIQQFNKKYIYEEIDQTKSTKMIV